MKSVSGVSIMFLSDMCILDRNSGAAIEMLDWMKMLAENGARVSSVSMSLFDGLEEYPFQMEFTPSIQVGSNVGKRLRIHKDEIEHNIFNVGTSIARNVSAELLRGFIDCAAEDIRRIQPRIVIGYGSRNLGPLRRLAKMLGAKTIFYLANDSYGDDKRACFDEVDQIITPSNALAGLYERRLGFKSHVIGNFIPEYKGIVRPSQAEVEARRKSGLITVVNPSLVKGGLFFIQIAAVLEKMQPDLTLVAIESRMVREHMEAIVNNASRLSNVWWLQRQSDMHRVYRHSAMLLMPSLWFEAAGRIVPEAQVHGVPVLAHRVGALTEQVGDGGELIDVPKRFDERSFDLLPTTEEVLPWVKAIMRTISSPKRYSDLSRRAIKASKLHCPESREKQILKFMSELLLGEIVCSSVVGVK